MSSFRGARSPVVAMFFLAGLVPANAFARFYERDAYEVDRESLLGTETFNDEWSYRYPMSWEKPWEVGQIGYRINAGSYNIRRFMFLEDIKLSTDPTRLWSFGFSQNRREDMLETRQQSELRVNYFPGFVRFGLLADGGTFKEHGDLGLSVGTVYQKYFSADLRYWSVDHYYNTKKEFSVDRYLKSPRTWELHLKLDASLWFVHYQYGIDTGMEWERLSQGYRYKSSRTTHELVASFGTEQISTRLLIDRDEKFEDKKYYLTAGDYEKSLNRWTDQYEWQMRWLTEAATQWVGGIIRLNRRADYSFWADAVLTSDQFLEFDEDDIKRGETGYYVTIAQKYTDAFGMQYGLFANSVRISDSDSSEGATEIKAQVAWEFSFDKFASLFINSTWDLDKLGNDFPYTKRGFKPWGGGNLQFQATF